MRRRPTHNEPAQTNVFSSDAWGSPSASYVAPEKEDLAQYAAALVPEGQNRTARAARYAPSANSAYYDQNSSHLTNSDQDPFKSAVLETRHDTRPQNARVEDMAQPVRRARLGDGYQYDVATPAQAPAPSVPSAYQAPVAYQAPSAPAPVAPPVQQAPAPAPQAPPQNHVSVQGIGTRSAPTPAAPVAPAAPQTPVQQTPAPVAPPVQQAPAAPVQETATQTLPVVDTEPEVIDIEQVEEEETILSDFEQEFIQAQSVEAPVAPAPEAPVAPPVQQAPAPAPEVPREVDLTQFDGPSAYAQPAPAVHASPQLFSTGISYQSSDDFFENMHENIADADRLYSPDGPTRETIRIDLDFVTRHLRNLVSKKAAIIVVALILAAGAYFVVRSVTTDSSSAPPAPQISQNTTDKQVFTDPNGQPVVTDQNGGTVPVGSDDQPIQPTTGSGQEGPTIYYDQNGQVIYSDSVNQNFNGE